MTYSRTLTEDELRERYAIEGAVFLERTFNDSKRSIIQFRCKCGTELSRPLGKPAVCRPCGERQRTERISASWVSQEQLESALFVTGATFVSRNLTNHDGTRITFLCSCGVEQTIRTGHLLNRQNARCSACTKATTEYKVGPEHPRWIEDRALVHQTMKSRVWSTDDVAWAEQVYQDHGYACYLTGRKGKLAAHHLYSRARFPEYRFHPLNGVCLLRELHVEFHSIYGKRRFTPEDFVKYAAIYGKVFTLPSLGSLDV